MPCQTNITAGDAIASVTRIAIGSAGTTKIAGVSATMAARISLATGDPTLATIIARIMAAIGAAKATGARTPTGVPATIGGSTATTTGCGMAAPAGKIGTVIRSVRAISAGLARVPGDSMNGTATLAGITGGPAATLGTTAPGMPGATGTTATAIAGVAIAGSSVAHRAASAGCGIGPAMRFPPGLVTKKPVSAVPRMPAAI